MLRVYDAATTRKYGAEYAMPTCIIEGARDTGRSPTAGRLAERRARWLEIGHNCGHSPRTGRDVAASHTCICRR